ncbi:MAG: hypothetical protein U0166_28315 [Acidobacteriota bacterium]
MMRHAIGQAVLVALAALPLRAEGLKKAYFAATPEESWARFRMSFDEGDAEWTYTRLPDESGRVRIQNDFKGARGQAPGVVSKTLFVMVDGFPFETDGINFARGIDRVRTQVQNGDEVEESVDRIKAIRKSLLQFRSFSYVGEEDVDGHKCDHYTYEAASVSMPGSPEHGDVWLDPKVPFAIRKQIGATTDRWGNEARYEIRMTACSGERTAPSPKREGPIGLIDAYEAGLVEIRIEAQAGGARLSLGVANTSSEDLKLVLAKGPVHLEAGAPLDTLAFEIGAASTVTVPRGAETRLVAVQVGHRVVGGVFAIAVRQGQHVVIGEVQVGEP